MGGFASKPSAYDTPVDVPSKYFKDFEATLPSMRGKTVVITGCTTGCGFVAARTMAHAGADVYLLNRPSERAVEAEKSIAMEALNAVSSPPASPTRSPAAGGVGSPSKLVRSLSLGNGGVITSVDCDLADFDSVRRAASIVSRKCAGSGVDVLCNNAGVMALPDVATKDGYDVQMQTNHLSHFLLTRELTPALEKAAELRGEARVVNHSSGARNIPRKGLEAKYFGENGGDLGGDGASMLFMGARWVRYGQTKLANAAFTVELDRRLRAKGSKVRAVVATPGFAATNLQVTTAKSGGFHDAWIFKRMAQSAEDGSIPLLTCMASPGVESGGLYEPAKMRLYGPAKKFALEKTSVDESAGAMLWEESEKAVGAFEV